MKITIIGGSGFVGSRLLQQLVKNKSYNVLNIDKSPSELYNDITIIRNVCEKKTLIPSLDGTELVILLAAEHRDDVSPSSLYYDVNVQGMKNVLEAMHHNGVKRLIFTSSVAIYGLDKNNPDETFPADPINHYGKSKWEAEQVLQDWYKVHPNWNINIIRPTVIFGEKNRGNVFNLLNQIASGKFMMVGKGNNKKSMSYVGNVVAFIGFLIEKQTHGYNIYNYVDKPDITTNDLVTHTSELLGKKVPAIRIPYKIGLLAGYCFDILAYLTHKKFPISAVRIKKFCAETKYDSTKAMTCGFIPPYTVEEGLKRMLQEEFMDK